MTPKDKAQDLVNQFRIVLMDEDTDCGNELLCTSIAIKNSLITVAQLINEYPSFPRGTWEESRALYWLDVRCELNTLILGE